MIVTCVYVLVKKEHIDDFIKATSINHKASVKEPGNLRFDFIQRFDDTTRFMVYEAYESEDAAAAHKDTPHYKEWRETVADWMASPREGIKYNILNLFNLSIIGGVYK